MKQITQQTENKFALGEKVIVNTGGKDTIAYIDKPVKNIHGFYWKEQGLYLCRFTDNPEKLLCNGAIKFEGGLYDVDKHYVHANAQYIPADCIKPFSEHPAEQAQGNESDNLDKEIDELEADLWNQPKGAPPTKEVSTVGYKLEWDNDTGRNDESYREWYNLINPDGETVANIPDQRDANKIVLVLNTHDSLVSALKEAMEIIDRLSEDVSTLSGKHSSYSQGEHRRLSKALNAATTK